VTGILSKRFHGQHSVDFKERHAAKYRELSRTPPAPQQTEDDARAIAEFLRTRGARRLRPGRAREN
jgi:hypothetical protein